MSDFSSLCSEMSDMELVTTKSRLKSGVCYYAQQFTSDGRADRISRKIRIIEYAP
ncbi:MAG: hypothetical protein K2J59_00540 [Eubacterium sp.]|nr:hypothetical protein [Eubacterium sp.]